MTTPNPHSSPGGGAWTPPSPEEIDAELADYYITDLLGIGGMGAVYKGTQAVMGRQVAIKVLPLAGIADDDMKFAERFQLEARSMAQLTHPAIVAVYGCGEAGRDEDMSAFLYFVMEFIEGTDIHGYLQECGGRIAPEHALAITCHVLDGLAFAHGKGIIHRDIKPANIMLDQYGRVKIADFGLAKQLDADFSLTMTNMAMGTPDYVAPEALEIGASVDGRSDLYSLGAMLYQMLTGAVPRGQFKSPSQLIEGLDRRFDSVVEKALQVAPDDRYPDALAFRADLDAILSMPEADVSPRSGAIKLADKRKIPQGSGSAAAAAKTSEIPASSSKKGPILSGLAAGILLGVGALFLLKPKEKAPPNPVKSVTQQGTVADPTGLDRNETRPTDQPEEVPQEAVDLTAYLDELDGGRKLPSTKNPQEAAKGKPFENSRGLRFVPVPIGRGETAGQRILFSIWETRLHDVSEYPGAEEETIGLTFPWMPVNLSRKTAISYAIWLTEKERSAGQLPEDLEYRLPTDLEWSYAAGFGALENLDVEPENRKLPEPVPLWGEGKYPQGRFADFPPGLSPGLIRVGNFSANQFGLYDLGGNLAEWVQESANGKGILRGSSFHRMGTAKRIDERLLFDSNTKGSQTGFRLVLAPVAKPEKPTPPEKPAPQNLTQTEPPPSAKPEPAPDPFPEFTSRKEKYFSVLEERAALPFREKLTTLVGNYNRALDRSIAAQAKAGDLISVNALRQEKETLQSFADDIPEKSPHDLALSDLPPDSPAALAQIRGTWNQAAGIYFQEFLTAETSLKQAFAKSLEGFQTALTKQQKIDQANEVNSYREKLLANQVEAALEKTEKKATSGEHILAGQFQPIPTGKNPYPLPRPQRPTEPCRIVAWRIDGEPVDAQKFVSHFFRVPAAVGTVVDMDMWNRHFDGPFSLPILALKADGSVVNFKPDRNEDCAHISDAIAIAGEKSVGAALLADGRCEVFPIYESELPVRQGSIEWEVVKNWKNIVSIDAGERHIVALDAEGTPHAAGEQQFWQSTIPAVAVNRTVKVAANSVSTRLYFNNPQKREIEIFNPSADKIQAAFDSETRFLGIQPWSTDARGRNLVQPFQNDAPFHIRNLSGSKPSDITAATHVEAKVSGDHLGLAAIREGRDKWRFWGDLGKTGTLNRKYCEERAFGCRKVFLVSPHYVIGLKPESALTKEDWTGEEFLTDSSEPEDAKNIKPLPEYADAFPLPTVKRPTRAGRLEVIRHNVGEAGESALDQIPGDMGSKVVDIKCLNRVDQGKDQSIAVALLNDGTVRVWTGNPDTTPEDPTFGAKGIVQTQVGVHRFFLLDEKGNVFGKFDGKGFPRGPLQTFSYERPVAQIACHHVRGVALLNNGALKPLGIAEENRNIPPTISVAVGFGAFALGHDGRWRYWDEQSNGTSHVVQTQGLQGIPWANGGYLYWIDSQDRSRKFHHGGTFPPADTEEPVQQHFRYVEFRFAQLKTGKWLVNGVPNEDKQRIEKLIQGAISVAAMNKYLFVIRPVGG